MHDTIVHKTGFLHYLKRKRKIGRLRKERRAKSLRLKRHFIIVSGGERPHTFRVDLTAPTTLVMLVYI